MKIALIGCGLIGQERLSALQTIQQKFNTDISVEIYDTNRDTLNKTREKFKNLIAIQHHTLQSILSHSFDWVFIATPNDVVYDITKKAFEIGANVLTEKPLGINLDICNKIIALKPDHLKLFVGFNYRFFDCIEAALHDAKSGKFGKLMSVNFILAHGNAPGMEKSWHLDPVKRGSVVADLGAHLFDLILQLSSGLVSVQSSKSWSGFWQTGITEETHMLLSDEAGTIYNAQVSFNRWRSNFRMEINGTEGYGIVEGRGRSYGPQSYKTGIRWGWQSGKKQAETETIVIDGDDCSNSFVKETAAVLDLNTYTSSPCSYLEAQKVMFLLDQVKNT